jgi:putative acyl-CoA dehydrogenase
MSDKQLHEFITHEVFNQSKPLIDYNLYSTNIALQEAVQREGADWSHAELTSWGEFLGRASTFELARLACKNRPILHAFDQFGNRRDEVEFHPAWHTLMTAAMAQGLHSEPWVTPKKGAHVARAAAYIMQSEIEIGLQCPLTMTYGCVPTIAKREDIASVWLPKMYARTYDPSFAPISKKASALIGMGMTEKQGGSDVRSNTSQATLVLGSNAVYEIVGHKWFFSAPMCDAFLILAQTPNGLSCFFLPRWLPDGSKNAIYIQRLKDKLGNTSNASSEVEFHKARGWLLGEEGRGVPTIIDMANYTRLDCALGTAGLMHQAVAQAINHASYRMTFKRKLIEHPLMQNVLADLTLEVEGAIALSLRLARAFDAQNSEEEAYFRRVVTPTAKYWICKRGSQVAAEAMEVLGGNGYVEEGSMARIYREMPLNSIWEGSGNIMCLDVLRAFGKTSEALELVRREWQMAKGANAQLDQFAAAIELDLRQACNQQIEAEARRLVERLALCLSAALLVRHAPNVISDAFCSSRLDRDWGIAFGTLNRKARYAEIIERGKPVEHTLATTPNASNH